VPQAQPVASSAMAAIGVNVENIDDLFNMVFFLVIVELWVRGKRASCTGIAGHCTQFPRVYAFSGLARVVMIRSFPDLHPCISGWKAGDCLGQLAASDRLIAPTLPESSAPELNKDPTTHKTYRLFRGTRTGLSCRRVKGVLRAGCVM